TDPRDFEEQLAAKAPALVAEMGENEAKKFETEFAALWEAIRANQANNQPISKLEWHWQVQPEDFFMFDYLKIFKKKKGTSVWVLPRDADRLDNFAFTAKILHTIGWFTALILPWRISGHLDSFLDSLLRHSIVPWVYWLLHFVLLFIIVGVNLFLVVYA